jgi:Ca-activated chloride channel family protein
MRISKKSIAIPGILLICSSIYLAAQNAKDATAPLEDNKVYRSQVDMASFPVAVTSQNGSYVKDLKKEDFQIFENGIEQEVAAFAAVEEPISVALMLDTSGSTEFQLTRIKNEGMRFIRLLREDDSVAVLSFADDVTLLEQFSLYHKKNPDVLRQIKPGGLSAVYEAVWLALEQVLKPEFGRKALVMLSDGVDTRSDTVTQEETLELAKKTDATIYPIYFNTNKDRSKRMPRIIDPMMPGSPGQPFAANQWPRIPMPSGKDKPEYKAGREYLETLAKYSGGLFVDASRIDNLSSAFMRIAQELWNQYSLGYYPKNLKHDGKFRDVQIRVKRAGLSVRTRLGFYDY